LDRGTKDISKQPGTDSRQGLDSGTTEIEEVDESWAIEMLEALEKEERESENRSSQSTE
jgi:hypothetical protein